MKTTLFLILLTLVTLGTTQAEDYTVTAKLNLLQLHKAGIIDTDEDETKWRIELYDLDSGKVVHKSPLLLVTPWQLDDAKQKTSAGILDYTATIKNKKIVVNLEVRLLQEVGWDDEYILGDVQIFDTGDNGITGRLNLTSDSKVSVDFE